MTIKPFDGFRSLETHHCVTGSMRHVYVFNDHDDAIFSDFGLTTCPKR